ncbi:MAG: LPS export ABC transporter permease LptG [Acidobacteriota bacterium]|nr:LPS export ABC transporter permease LptG [Acidobacteriota bacterium]
MRILTRYILGEILSHALIGCAVFTFILFMRDLPHILEMVVRNSSTFSAVAEVFLFNLPNTLRVTIPMAVLVGILLGLGRLAADSEIIAMRASGLGIGFFVGVASIVAAGGTLLGLANTLYFGPRANQAILDLQQELVTSQASYEIQPRVFYEDFKNYVLYVQDVRSSAGASNWRQVFMADVSNPANPLITTAASATVVNDSTQSLLMRLRDGTRHETVAGHPDQYTISTFTSFDRPLVLNPQSDIHLGRLDTSIYAMPTSALMGKHDGPDALKYAVELQTRFAYPAACLVLMLVGVPLGMISRRGGKSSGMVYTLLLVVLYYILSYTGFSLSRQGKLPPFVGVWSANLLFAAAGFFLLSQMATGGRVLNALAGLTARTPKPATVDAINGTAAPGLFEKLQPIMVHRAWGVFPRILDAYVIREFIRLFLFVLVSFVVLMLLFTSFELVGDIVRNHIALTIVGAYLFHLTPSMIYQITPLAVLIAVLVSFGVFNRNSEIIAMKATGISLYRLVVPVVSLAAILSAGMFFFNEYYVPQANRQQEALRSTIKGHPPQTFLHPEQKWMFGQSQPGQTGRIYYYQFFDPDRNEFANMSIFEFDPHTFSLTKRIYASRVYWNDDKDEWIFQNGWVRDMNGANVSQYSEFTSSQFPEMHEEPGYFKKESLQSQEMNFGQLEDYIRDLRQSGFDTMRLRVALWHKLADPLVIIVMAVLAIPFALSMGRSGSLTGIAVAISIALSYWVLNGLLGAMGTVNYLPAAVAAWTPDILFGLAGGYLLLRTPT